MNKREVGFYSSKYTEEFQRGAEDYVAEKLENPYKNTQQRRAWEAGFANAKRFYED